MKVAVVGSGGFLGRCLVQTLEEEGVVVLCFSSRTRGGLDPKTGHVSKTLRLDEVDAVVYLAQSPHSGNNTPEMAAHVLQVNLVSAVEFAERARQSGVHRFVYASTGNVYHPAFQAFVEGDLEGASDWYALSKLQGEGALGLFRAFMDVHILRLFGVYGPGQKNRLIPKLVRTILGGSTVYVERNPMDPGDVCGLRLSLGYVDDVVRIILQICQRGGPDLMNVAGDEVISIRKAAIEIGSAVGREPCIELADSYRRGDLIADVSRLKRYCNEAFTPFSIGLAKTLGWRNFG